MVPGQPLGPPCSAAVNPIPHHHTEQGAGSSVQCTIPGGECTGSCDDHNLPAVGAPGHRVGGGALDRRYRVRRARALHGVARFQGEVACKQGSGAAATARGQCSLARVSVQLLVHRPVGSDDGECAQ